MRFASARQTNSQLLSISGSPPWLMELQKNWQSSTNIAGEQGLPLNIFFFIVPSTLDLNWVINYKNLGLS